MAPMAARAGTRTAPTTPIVKGTMRMVFPSFESMEIFRILPSWINSLTFLRSSSPLTSKVSAFGVVVDMGNFNKYVYY